MRVRSPTRSVRWSASRRSSRSGPARRAAGRPGSARAARATAAASIGSLLPRVATAAPDARHEPRRDAHAALAVLDEEALKPPGDVTAVLDGEAALEAQRARPGEQAGVAGPGRGHGELADELARGGLDGHCGVALLVRVDPEYHHAVPLSDAPSGSAGPPVDTPQWGPLGCPVPVQLLQVAVSKARSDDVLWCGSRGGRGLGCSRRRRRRGRPAAQRVSRSGRGGRRRGRTRAGSSPGSAPRSRCSAGARPACSDGRCRGR